MQKMIETYDRRCKESLSSSGDLTDADISTNN